MQCQNLTKNSQTAHKSPVHKDIFVKMNAICRIINIFISNCGKKWAVGRATKVTFIIIIIIILTAYSS
jgi:hypothetical protein